MEQERKDILDRNETEKMCSLVGNEAGEMCSPADTDTCGKYLPPRAGEQLKNIDMN